MQRFLGCLLLAIAGAVTTPAMARTPVPLINQENVPVGTAGGVSATDSQVRQAIESAAASREWDVRPLGPGLLQATLTVRNKHVVTTEIAYSAQSYSIRYRDSVNMNYKAGDAVSGTGAVIHPFYNRWVDDLNRAIRLSLGKIS